MFKSKKKDIKEKFPLNTLVRYALKYTFLEPSYNLGVVIGYVDKHTLLLEAEKSDRMLSVRAENCTVVEGGAAYRKHINEKRN